jgi:hypothetical protein
MLRYGDDTILGEYIDFTQKRKAAKAAKKAFLSGLCASASECILVWGLQISHAENAENNFA